MGRQPKNQQKCGALRGVPTDYLVSRREFYLIYIGATLRPWLELMKRKMSKRDKKRVAAKKGKKKYQMTTKKLNAAGKLSVPSP